MDTVKKSKHKEKRRSNEKRKERSRDAARCRRSRETDIFVELANALPIPQEQAAHLDKASVMRLAIAYLKVRAVVDALPEPAAKHQSITSHETDQMFPKALNGFMLVLASDGNMVYLSENVSDYLGISQMDMMGQSVYEYSHPCDHNELRECLSTKSLDSKEKRPCNFFLRLKCTLTSKGRKVNLKSASYKVIHCTGSLTRIHNSFRRSSESSEEDERSSEKNEIERDPEDDVSLVLIGSPIPHPSNIEIPLGRHTFLSKHSLSMKFTYADEKLAEYLGWNSEELMGQSVFEFHHALDNLALDKSFKSLFSKGQCETVAYRFLGKRGGYAWVVTQATLIHCSKQHKPLSVVCVNYVLSGVEREDEVYSARQLAAREPTVSSLQEPSEKLNPTTTIIVASPSEPLCDTSLSEPENRSRPQTVTASLFRPVLGYPPKREAPPASLTDEEKEEGEEAAKPAQKKEEPPETTENCRVARTRPRSDFVFQGKPALEYEGESTARREQRPQAVTRQLFAPLQQQEQFLGRTLPQTATASIFAPRTEDMNKGFLTFSEDQPGLTMLKDEPDDLTHLAPTPGDVCVPLEDTPFFTDMLDEFILGNDNYCPLLSPGEPLSPELRTSEFAESSKDVEFEEGSSSPPRGKTLDSDPFMYGDSPSSPATVEPSPHVAGAPLDDYHRHSPEESIVDSLGSPNGNSATGEALSEDEMLMLGVADGMADDELALRAPYIPMSDQDEALELLISDDMVMWSPSHNVGKNTSKCLLAEEKEPTTNIGDSSLAQLLRTEQAVARRYNDHGGGLVNTAAQLLGQTRPGKGGDYVPPNRWCPKVERKRIHCHSTEPGNERKRMKCEDSPGGRTSSEPGLPVGGNSQLLRRLVSQPMGAAPEDEKPGGVGRARGQLSEQRVAQSGISAAAAAAAAEDIVNTDPIRTAISPSNSVLMNLLVSGCDVLQQVQLSGLRNVPSALGDTLDVTHEDDRTVPRCPVIADPAMAPADPPNHEPHKRQASLFNNRANNSLLSPPSTASYLPFHQLEYDVDVSGSELLQASNDLLGSFLLDRTLA